MAFCFIKFLCIAGFVHDGFLHYMTL
jgi:hypothetical protein